MRSTWIHSMRSPGALAARLVVFLDAGLDAAAAADALADVQRVAHQHAGQASVVSTVTFLPYCAE
jgi:hypothetical protein